MLNNEFWKTVFEKQKDFDASRFLIIKESSDALQASKQAIFSIQRENENEAQEKLESARKVLKSLDERYGDNFRLRMEGSWKAAVEEFVEAKLFLDFYLERDLDEIKDFNIEADEYIGGLSDTTGEIIRMMVIWTTKKEIEKVKKANEAVHNIIHELMQYNFIGYLRTKFDQSKNNLRKAEEILYDISIRNIS
ncbi:hypothetical protein KKC32_01850 [Patescibacteria group bacterium]|nr:hypothetical protein [Patescibacteria group bacterium]